MEICTELALKLQDHGSAGLQEKLRDPLDSRFCQKLGLQMREAGIEAFEYHSARCNDDVVQVGVISCRGFRSMPFEQITVQMESSTNEVAFLCLDDNSVSHFNRAQFLINSILP